MIVDYGHNEVRLALADATDIARVPGQFDGVVGGRVIVTSGTDLLAVARNGSVTKLGRLAGQPQWSGPGSVAVNPSLTQWIYTLTDAGWTSHIHLGSPSGDSVIADVASPDGNGFYQAFAWNASGAYVVEQATGLGGVGPFLEYHFPLDKLDVASGRVTAVTPSCVGEQVLDDGTMLCRTSSGGVDVRTPAGASHVIQLAVATSGMNGVYSRLTVTPDQHHFVAARNGSADPSLVNYQMVAADFNSSSASVFGPIDFYPDAWLPDGRLVADHVCWTFQQDGGSCDQSLDGTYFVSADGKSRTLFYKLAQGSYAVATL